ncbi:CoA transferase [Bradyrhizobium sp. LHD-71]|uniref:CaiB/BaiF CoA transferase family protein n=1 Tax=Bradyrhizobium sp. LHD-71 TaxID=3072141 RepID=UPI00280C9BDD|nr:CoA transferase [Bradyrhizobium sp. LHD-71]MDQ8728235.1 CoA transferase [Bradyrhizobium sp. LHD-71]
MKSRIGPLAGIKVVDLSSVLMGPLCTQILADNGAEVIKIERLEGDTTRGIGPSRSPGMGPLFLHLNRSKKSVSLDLKDPRCREAALRLIKDADVIVHNLRPRVIERLGFGFEAVSHVNPKIVYCSLYGFDQKGPAADHPAYDDLIQGAAALPSLQKQAGSTVPRYVAMNIADRLVGISAAYAISMGLLASHRTGTAQKIDVPMFETLTAHVLSDHLYGRTFVPPVAGAGYPRLLAEDRRPFATSDGHICMAIYTDRHWRAFLAEVGREDLMKDPRFKSIGTRTEAVAYVYGFLAETLAASSTQFWLSMCNRLDIPAARLNTIDELLSDPQCSAAELVGEVNHPTEGRLMAIRNPILWQDAALAPGHAPLLGQHTLEALQSIGLSAEDITHMQADGVINLHPGK